MKKKLTTVPGFFIAGPRPKVEGRERGWGSWGGAATPSHQLRSLGDRYELPQQGTGQSLDRPKVVHNFQHSWWPLMTLYGNIVYCGLSCSHCGARPLTPPPTRLAYGPDNDLRNLTHGVGLEA